MVQKGPHLDVGISAASSHAPLGSDGTDDGPSLGRARWRVWPGAPGRVGRAGRASGLAVESSACGERPELPQEQQCPGLTQATVRTAKVRRGPSAGPGQLAEGAAKEVSYAGNACAHVYAHAFTCVHAHTCVYACVHTGRVRYPGWGPMRPREVRDPGENCSRLKILRGTALPPPPPSSPDAVSPERHRMPWSQAGLASPGPGEHPTHQVHTRGWQVILGRWTCTDRPRTHKQRAQGRNRLGMGGKEGQEHATKSQRPRTGNPLGWQGAGRVSPVGCKQAHDGDSRARVLRLQQPAATLKATGTGRPTPAEPRSDRGRPAVPGGSSRCENGG